MVISSGLSTDHASHTATPIELLTAQVDCETFTLPTGSHVFNSGTPAAAIYGLRRGIVELEGPDSARICYRPGELFSFQDIVWRQGLHRSDAATQAVNGAGCVTSAEHLGPGGKREGFAVDLRAEKID
ncbi:MAG: hypothetical protein ACKOPS_25060, partial [Cyanobium sp.]